MPPRDPVAASDRRWLVQRAVFGSADLARLLEDSWEPFGVAVERMSNHPQWTHAVVYVRREVLAKGA